MRMLVSGAIAMPSSLLKNSTQPPLAGSKRHTCVWSVPTQTVSSAATASPVMLPLGKSALVTVERL